MPHFAAPNKKGLPHMAPQDDLTAERAAALLKELRCQSADDPFSNFRVMAITAALKTARQEALREGPSHLRQMAAFTSDQELKNMYLDIANELDRLASEGAPSPIDLSSKFNDDGGYGEHF
jgi:hypothetical protein